MEKYIYKNTQNVIQHLRREKKTLQGRKIPITRKYE